MSSPTKQVSVRRLPPLPNQITLRNVKDHSNPNEDNHGGSLKGKPSGGSVIFPVKILNVIALRICEVKLVVFDFS